VAKGEGKGSEVKGAPSKGDGKGGNDKGASAKDDAKGASGKGAATKGADCKGGVKGAEGKDATTKGDAKGIWGKGDAKGGSYKGAAAKGYAKGATGEDDEAHEIEAEGAPAKGTGKGNAKGVFSKGDFKNAAQKGDTEGATDKGLATKDGFAKGAAAKGGSKGSEFKGTSCKGDAKGGNDKGASTKGDAKGEGKGAEAQGGLFKDAYYKDSGAKGAADKGAATKGGAHKGDAKGDGKGSDTRGLVSTKGHAKGAEEDVAKGAADKGDGKRSGSVHVPPESSPWGKASKVDTSKGAKGARHEPYELWGKKGHKSGEQAHETDRAAQPEAEAAAPDAGPPQKIPRLGGQAAEGQGETHAAQTMVNVHDNIAQFLQLKETNAPSPPQPPPVPAAPRPQVPQVPPRPPPPARPKAVSGAPAAGGVAAGETRSIVVKHFPASWLLPAAAHSLVGRITDLFKKFGPLESQPFLDAGPPPAATVTFQQASVAALASKKLHGVDNRTREEIARCGNRAAMEHERFHVQLLPAGSGPAPPAARWRCRSGPAGGAGVEGARRGH